MGRQKPFRLRLGLAWGRVKQAEGDGNGNRQECSGGEHELLGKVKFVHQAVGHNVNHPLFEIGASNARDAGQRGTQAKFTDFQNALGINLAVAAEFDDLLVTGALALFEQARSQPPDKGIEPENRFDQHVHRGVEIVATAYVPDFVCEDGFEVRVFQAVRDPSGQISTGRVMPKIPGSSEARDSSMSIGLRIPPTRSRRRSAPTSRPSRNRSDDLIAAEMRCQRIVHTNSTASNPPSQMAVAITGKKWSRLGCAVEAVVVPTAGAAA